ncbi:MAG: MFS transporter [Thermoleophilia bacterium]
MIEGDTRLGPRSADRFSVLLALGFLAASILQGAIPVLAPDLRADEGLSSARVGLLMSAFLVAYAAGNVLAGGIAARRAGRVLAVGFTGMVLGALLFAFSSSYPWYLVARGLQGAGAGTMLPAAGVLLARCVPLDRLGRAWSIYGGASGVGYLLLFLVLARIVEKGGHRPFFLVIAGLVAATGFVTFTSSRVRSGPPAGSAQLTLPGLASDMWLLVRSRRVTLLGLINVAGITVAVGTLTWTPAYIHDQLGAGLGTAAALTAGFAAAQLVGAPIVAFLVTRVGYLPLLAGVFVAMAAALVALPQLPGLFSTFVVVFFMGMLTMLAFAPSFALIPLLVERRLVGLAGGYLNAFGFAGALFGPWLFGVFIDQGWGYTRGFSMLALFAVAGLGAIEGLRRAMRSGRGPAGVVH